MKCEDCGNEIKMQGMFICEKCIKKRKAKKTISTDIENKINYLKNNPSMGYTQLMKSTYKFIKSAIKYSGNNYCNPTDQEIADYVYDTTEGLGKKNMTRKFIYNLKQLNYIKIIGKGENRKIFIIKELDF